MSVNSARPSHRTRTAAAAVLAGACLGAQADCFERHAGRFNLDPNLLRAIAAVESGHRPEAVNRSHVARTGSLDVGLMQINTGWLPRLAKYGIAATDLKDPCTSVEIGAWILADLVQRHGNQWEAVGAYNAACSELKGAACVRARSDYAWKVYRRLGGTAKGKQARAAVPAVATVSLASPGLMSMSASTDSFAAQSPGPQP